MENKENKKQECKCENCSMVISKEEKSKNLGFCDSCEKEGFWIDPACGVHSADEEDFAAMYE